MICGRRMHHTSIPCSRFHDSRAPGQRSFYARYACAFCSHRTHSTSCNSQTHTLSNGRACHFGCFFKSIFCQITYIHKNAGRHTWRHLGSAHWSPLIAPGSFSLMGADALWTCTLPNERPNLLFMAVRYLQHCHRTASRLNIVLMVEKHT